VPSATDAARAMSDTLAPSKPARAKMLSAASRMLDSAIKEPPLRRPTFLLINGLRIVARDEDAQEFVLGLCESGQLKFENLRVWLTNNTSPV